jgi:hypothetical protein
LQIVELREEIVTLGKHPAGHGDRRSPPRGRQFAAVADPIGSGFPISFAPLLTVDWGVNTVLGPKFQRHRSMRETRQAKTSQCSGAYGKLSPQAGYGEFVQITSLVD